MTALVLVALAVAAYVALRPRSRRTGPGASAAARARQLRTPLVRAADALGIPTQRGREAARYRAGAVGEQHTAQRLAPLEREGWTVLHDRALPGSRANLDHLLVSPSGTVIVPDSKRWSAKYPVRVSGGRLLHGEVDVTGRLRGLRHEAGIVSRLLGVHAIPLVVMDGPPVQGAALRVGDIRIVAADRSLTAIRALDQFAPQRDRRTPQHLAERAVRLFPPYLERAQ